MTEPPTSSLAPILELVRTLRGPGGCPWDRRQRLEDLRAYLLEEAHETAAAIDEAPSDGGVALREETGDLLFQLCFLVELAEEQRLFRLDEAVDGVVAKMVERHPHVFGEERLETAEDVASAWERRKSAASDASVLAGVPTSLPALVAAYRIGQKAAGIGFDWERAEDVLGKIDEERVELEEAISTGNTDAIEDEVGDLLLTMASLSRHLGVDPERALARANAKFRRRFAVVEEHLARREGDRPADVEELERLWGEAKSDGRSSDQKTLEDRSSSADTGTNS